MPPRDIYYPNTGLKTLGYDPAFHLVRPAPISTRPLQNLNAAVKPVPAIRHRQLLLNAQKETSPLEQRHGTAEINGTGTAHTVQGRCRKSFKCPGSSGDHERSVGARPPHGPRPGNFGLT